MKPALVVATLLLAGTAACGGAADDAPAGVTEAEFCETYNSLFAEAGVDDDASDAEIIEEIRAWGRRLEETGPPESMSEEARQGFEETVERLQGLDPDAGQEQLERLEEEATDEARRTMQAFDDFSLRACGSPLDGTGSPESPE